MDKEELRKEAQESYIKLLRQNNCGQDYNCEIYNDGYIAGAESREKRIAELEEKISVLLSCKKCPDNKGGYICQKEYENKCLAQKIQYIKELQEENAELEEKNIELLGKLTFTENALNNAKAQIEKMKCPQNCKNGSVYNWSDNSICMDCEKVRTLHEDNWQEMCKGCKYWELRR